MKLFNDFVIDPCSFLLPLSIYIHPTVCFFFRSLGHRQDYDFGGSLGGGGFGGVSSTGSGGGGGEDFLVEILGTLANLTTFDLPRTAKDPKPAWGNVLKRTGLLQVWRRMGSACVFQDCEDDAFCCFLTGSVDVFLYLENCRHNVATVCKFIEINEITE
jgi:hypothetical protein